MRYFISSNYISELTFRQDYLLETFGLWFVDPKMVTLPISKYSFVIFESFPINIEEDICLIYGHNYEIEALFNECKELLYEKTIYIISCKARTRNGYIIKGKNVFLSKIAGHYNDTLVGSEFGFEFPITEAELNLYNSKEKDIRKKLNSYFELLKKT